MEKEIHFTIQEARAICQGMEQERMEKIKKKLYSQPKEPMIKPFNAPRNEWSICCGALVHDPGGTGEGLCAECGEHTAPQITKEFDMAFLDFTTGEAHIVRLEYDSSIHENIDEAVSMFFEENNIDFANTEFMCSEDKPIVAVDHRERFEEVM